ncbi:SMI1/KNR4 family protein [Sporosarcina sp. SAFN-015]|uniref:SMI1/KNR4 family protein n=1 Tax=Sporosarcina sp. SAFN-015 TaxID=3387274 RepID=UPI003F81B02E
MWIDYIRALSSGDYSYKPSASESEMHQVAEELGVGVSEKLMELYRETNGVFDSFGCPLIWSISRVVEDNLFFRNFEDYKDIYMPFNHLLFFSDNGCGDLFGYRIANGSIPTDDIYVWNHEDDSRTWVASS